MDSLTQIVLGAAVGEAILGKKVGNKAILWGAIVGTIPDLDVLMEFFVDDLTAKEMHRGFSHSILFSIIFAPILGWLASRIHSRDGLSWKPWTLLAFGSLFTHPLLDAHTNWGTMLFWSFEYKVAYNNIFIVDPLYTLPFLTCLIVAMTLHRSNPKRTMWNRIGLIISSVYMCFTLVSKGVGYHYFKKNLSDQGIQYVRMMTNATTFNSILWTAGVETENEYLIGYYSLFDLGADIKFAHFDKNRYLLGEMAKEDLVQRVIELSQGWYIILRQEEKLIINDMRFGQLGINSNPNSFPFSHEFWYDNGALQIAERQKDVNEIGPAIGVMLSRILEK